MEKLKSIGENGVPVFDSGIDRAKTNSPDAKQSVSVPNGVSRSSFFNDMAELLTGRAGVQIYGTGESSGEDFGRKAANLTRKTILDLGNNNELYELIQIMGHLGSEKGDNKNVLGGVNTEDIKSMTELVSDMIDQLIQKHAVTTDENFYESSQKGKYFKRGNSYEGNNKGVWIQTLYIPDFEIDSQGRVNDIYRTEPDTLNH